MDQILGDRDVRRLSLAVLALLEDHLEGDEEEQQAASYPEGGQGNAEDRQDSRSGYCEQRHYAESNQRGADGHLVAFVAVHAAGERQEQRRQSRRIDRYEDGQEGVEESVVVRHCVPTASKGKPF